MGLIILANNMPNSKKSFLKKVKKDGLKKDKIAKKMLKNINVNSKKAK